MEKEKVLTAEQMKALDAYTINEIGVPSMVLMERAALAITEELFASDVVFDTGRVICVCGTGNNGGDGVAVARLLHLRGIEAEVMLIGDRGRCTQETSQQLKIAENYGVKVYEGLGISRIKELLAKATTVLDAMFGVGLARDLEGIYRETAEAIVSTPVRTSLPVRVLSVDIPSGVSADTGEVLGAAVKADKTVVLAYQKIGMTIEPGVGLAGQIVIKDIGITLQPIILNSRLKENRSCYALSALPYSD
jgi:NAD(P)H-hydrate epimerase